MKTTLKQAIFVSSVLLMSFNSAFAGTKPVDQTNTVTTRSKMQDGDFTHKVNCKKKKQLKNGAYAMSQCTIIA